MKGRPGWSVLEEPGQQNDDHNERNETAADVHSGLLCLIDETTTAEAGKRLRRSLRWRGGAVAEWLGRGLQSLVQRFESARRLLSRKLKLANPLPGEARQS